MKRIRWLLLLLMALLAVTASAEPAIQTLITNGLAEPYGIAVDESNNFYISDSVHNRIAKFNPTTGVLQTLAGSEDEAGNSDGPGIFARFFNPQGIVAARGGLVVADSGNHTIRFVALDGTVTTLAGGSPGLRDGAGAQAQFNAPAGVAADSAGNIYVADMLNGRLRKIDPNNVVSTVATGLTRPEGVTVDEETGRIFVADTGTHTIRAVETDGTVSVVAGTGVRGFRNDLIASKAQFNAPRGLLWVGGKTGLVVSDTGNHLVRRVYFNTNPAVNGYSVETFTPAESALVSPVGLAFDDNGNIPVVDLATHSVHSIQLTIPQPPIADPRIGYVILTTNLFGQLRTSLVTVTNATFNNDVRVAILAERGTDTFYTLDPEADFPQNPNTRNTPPAYEDGLLDWTHSIVQPAIDGSDVIVRAVSTQTGRKSSSVVTAIFKFKAAGTVINGKNPGGFTMENATEGAQMWYTTDGTTPTNAPPSKLYVPGSRLNIVDGTNNVVFKVGAFKPGYTPSFVEKTFLFSDLATSSIGVTRDFPAGIGSTVLVPVEVKLGPEDKLQSLQFRFELEPNNGAPSISTQLRVVNISTNDFIQIPPPSVSPPVSSVYTSGEATGLNIAYISELPGLNLEESGVAALIAVPIPANATEGQTYTIRIKEPSGTLDGGQVPVPLTVFSSRSIVVTNISYIVGDSAVANWHNAGEFGNGNLNNNDVNNAFHASLGLMAIPAFSDVFDAMDAYPEDSVGVVGGDGQIRFLDWQVILQRSLRQQTNNWRRSWAPGGVRVASAGTLNSAASTRGRVLEVPPPGAVWVRQGLVGSATLENVQPGAIVNLPVYVTVATGEKLSGFQFLATIIGSDGAPDLSGPARFIRAAGIPSSRPVDVPRPNQVAYAWDLGSFNPPLEGKHLLGHVQFTVPASAAKGQCYTLRFGNADGAPDLETQYAFETLPACVWVRTAAARPDELISDEWRVHFFGDLANPLAASDADADLDGVPNWREYRSGTDPMDALSRLHLFRPQTRVNLNRRQVVLRWLSAPGKTYILESTPSLTSGTWTPVATDVPGDGNIQEIIDGNPSGTSKYYRVRVK